MDWIQYSDYFSETKDRRYRVSQAQVKGKKIYTAWKRIRRYEGCLLTGDPSSKHVYLPFFYTDSPLEARLACERDAVDGQNPEESG